MIEINAKQGSPEWHAARAKCFNASEAPAMMGVSNYMTRKELIKQKATGIVPEVDANTQRRFDEGHRVEALARPLAEAIIGEELYPIVATDDAGRLLASSDGATMLCNIGFEHKLWNSSIAATVDSGEVPESHKWQLDQQCAVFGFDKIIFVCSDGTEQNFVYCWYSTTPERIAQLKAGWDQFEKDVAAYVPEATKPDVNGKAPDSLPALRIEVTGMVTASNLADFKAHALAVFSGINTTLVTDQDFADAEQAVRYCKEAEDRIEAAKQNALGQTTSIDELFRTMDAIKEEARSVRLKLDKLVKAEKENRKAEIVSAAQQEMQKHIYALTERVGVPVSIGPSPFGEAIKGLKSLDSMRDKVSSALANAKIEANAIADRIDANRKTVDDMTLFPDFAQVCTKAPDDFAALMAMRVGQRQARLEAETARIRAEEQAKAEAKARAEAQAAAARDEVERLAAIPKPEPVCVEEKPKFETQQPLSSTGDTQATIKLGDICNRLGFTVTANFLESLGFPPSATDKSARLYREAQFPAICRAIVKHINDVATGTIRLAA